MFELVRVIQERDPANPSFIEVLFAYPGYHAVSIHQFTHWIWSHNFRTLARLVAHIGRLLTGIEIHPGAKIGERLFIDHGMGVVIGQTAIVGDDVTLYHGVTLGGRGDGQSGEKRHPTLQNGVMVGSFAQVLGDITIGENARIGASAVVINDVPAGCTAIGNPARFVNCKGQSAAYGLPSSRNVVDPVGETIDGLVQDIKTIKAHLKLDHDNEDELDKADPDAQDYADRWKGSGI